MLRMGRLIKPDQTCAKRQGRCQDARHGPEWQKLRWQKLGWSNTRRRAFTPHAMLAELSVPQISPQNVFTRAAQYAQPVAIRLYSKALSFWRLCAYSRLKTHDPS